METMANKKKNKLEFLKLPPQSIDAECAVLGGLLLDNKYFDELQSIISEADFYKIENRLLYESIGKIISDNKPCDGLTLIEHLKKQDVIDDVGGEFYVFDIINKTPSVANIIAYANIIHENSILRKLITTANEISDSAFNAKSLDLKTILEMAESKVLSITQHLAKAQSVITQKEALRKAVERVDKLYHQDSDYTGLETGFRDFDNLTKGLQDKDMIVIAGRPSMGKTTFAMNLVENIAIKLQKPILIASLEMGEDQLMARMISSTGKIDHETIYSGKLKDEDWPKFSTAVQRLDQTRITFVTDGFMSPSILRAHARRVKKTQGDLGLIVIDYLQLMSLRDFKENRTMEITTISRELKLLAKEMDVPVIVISQLNRSLESRQDKRPTMADLRDSGAIEQDADLICFLYRDEVYNLESPDKGKAEVIIAKHRNGKTGRINLAYRGQYMRFENLEYEIPRYLK